MKSCKGVYYLLRLLARDWCLPPAETIRFGSNQIVEQVYRTSRIAVPCRVITDRCFNVQLGTDLAVEARFSGGGEAGRKPGQDSRSCLTEQIFRQDGILALFIVRGLEIPANARTLITPADFHGSHARTFDTAA